MMSPAHCKAESSMKYKISINKQQSKAQPHHQKAKITTIQLFSIQIKGIKCCLFSTSFFKLRISLNNPNNLTNFCLQTYITCVFVADVILIKETMVVKTFLYPSVCSSLKCLKLLTHELWRLSGGSAHSLVHLSSCSHMCLTAGDFLLETGSHSDISGGR